MLRSHDEKLKIWSNVFFFFQNCLNPVALRPVAALLLSYFRCGNNGPRCTDFMFIWQPYIDFILIGCFTCHSNDQLHDFMFLIGVH